MDKRTRMGILGVGLGEALIAGNFSIVSTSLSTIQREFQATFLDIQWMLNILGIFVCVSLVLMGRLADTFGRKKIFLIGLVGSGAASLISGFALASSWIIFAQMIQGIAGAILLPVSQALMSHLFPEDKRSHAIGIWAAIAGIILGVGPLLAGTIIEFVGWRWIFFINVPVALFAIAIVCRFIEESKSPHKVARFDSLGCLLLMLTIGSFVVAVIQGPSWGWGSWPTVLSFALFFSSLPLLIYVESRCPDPIIHPEFFLKKGFLLPSLSNFCLVFYIWTLFFLLPLYLQQIAKDTPFITGLLMLLATGPVALFSHTVGKWYGKVGPKGLMIFGFCFLILSILIQFAFGDVTPLWVRAAVSLSFGIGWVLVWGPSTTAAISSLPRDLAGIASGAFTTIQEVGALVGLTITGTIFRVSANPFMEGYRNTLWVLLPIMGIGIISSLAIKKKDKIFSK